MTTTGRSQHDSMNEGGSKCECMEHIFQPGSRKLESSLRTASIGLHNFLKETNKTIQGLRQGDISHKAAYQHVPGT